MVKAQRMACSVQVSWRACAGLVALALAGVALPARGQAPGWLAQEAPVAVAHGGKAGWPLAAGVAADAANLFVLALPVGGSARVDLTPAMTVEGGQLQIDLAQVGLPVGKYEIEVSTIAGDGQLQVLARTALDVTADAAAAATPGPAGSMDPVATRSTFTPRLDVGIRSQIFDRRNVDAGPSARGAYADLTLEGGFQSEAAGEDWELKSNVSFSGNSYPGDAVQNAKWGARAPRVDVSNYLVEGGFRDTRFALGNINVATHPLLVQGISNRGVSVAGRLPLDLDVNASVQSGGAEAGIDNLLGVAVSRNMFRQIGLGFDVDRDRPGKARFDVTRVLASQQVGTLLTGGPAVEKSEGYGVRFSGRNSDGRGRAEVSVAVSTHTPAGDPPPPDNKGHAWTAEVGYDFIKDWAITPTLPLNVNAAVRVEHSSPVFRSLGSPFGSNYHQNIALFNVRAGPGQLQGQVVRRFDNVGADHAYIRNQVSSWSLNGSFPLDQLVFAFMDKPAEPAPAAPAPAATTEPASAAQAAPAAPPAPPKPNPFWPALTLSRKSVLGYGSTDFIPVGYTADDLPVVHVMEQAWGLRWSFESIQFGVKRATVVQDNRQVGFDQEDVTDVKWGYAVDYKPVEALSIGVSHDLSSNTRFVTGVVADQFQSRIAVSYAITSNSQFSVELNRSLSRDTALALTVQRGVQVQYTYKFKTPPLRAGGNGLPAQFYVRMLGTTGYTGQGLAPALTPRSYALQTGLTLSFF